MEPASPAPAPTEPPGPGKPETDIEGAAEAVEAGGPESGDPRPAGRPETGGPQQVGVPDSGGARQAGVPDSGAQQSDAPESGGAQAPGLEAGASPAGQVPVARASRSQERRPRDMILSLAVLLVPVALLVILYRTLFNGDAPITVDPAPTIQEAQQAKLFPVAVPQGLGDDWHPSSATFTRSPTGATLRIGYVDPDKDPIQLIESSIPTDTLLPAELTRDARPTGTFRATNGVWRLFDGRPGEQALVMADQSRTIIIVGKTDVDNMEKLAGSLS